MLQVYLKQIFENELYTASQSANKKKRGYAPGANPDKHPLIERSSEPQFRCSSHRRQYTPLTSGH